MANAVFIQNPVSNYKDRRGEQYHFPKRYLGVVKETVGDWVVFYEGRKGTGAFGYIAVQKVLAIEEDNELEGHYFAILEPATELSFEQTVPRGAPNTGVAFEKSLRGEDGRPISGGASVSAVRRLTNQEFAAILQYGLQEIDGPDMLPRYEVEQPTGVAHSRGLADPPAQFESAPLAGFRPEILMSRKFRDQSFARQVKAAYGGRCAISGLELRNGGGRPEVEAAHIRPVAHNGPDIVRNGLALSGTLHWMFDRGLISVSSDYRILVSHNKVDNETIKRLIAPEQKLLLPKDKKDYPHPDYLCFHRETIFGQVA